MSSRGRIFSKQVQFQAHDSGLKQWDLFRVPTLFSRLAFRLDVGQQHLKIFGFHSPYSAKAFGASVAQGLESKPSMQTRQARKSHSPLPRRRLQQRPRNRQPPKRLIQHLQNKPNQLAAAAEGKHLESFFSLVPYFKDPILGSTSFQLIPVNSF